MMKRSVRRNEVRKHLRTASVLTACVALFALTCLLSDAAESEETSARPLSASSRTCGGESDSPRAAVSGMRVHVDPETGQFVEHPAEAPLAEVPSRQAQMLSTSSEALVEVPGSTPAGGVTVHLQGRFRAVMTASQAAAGELSTRCVTTNERFSGAQ